MKVNVISSLIFLLCLLPGVAEIPKTELLAEEAVGTPESTPIETVRDFILNGVMAIQTNPLLQGKEHRNDRRGAIKGIIARSFHFEGMSRLALRDHWDKLNGSDRAEFQTLFQDLFQDSYTKLVLDFLRQEKIIYGSEETRQDKALVKTRIIRMSEEIPVDYSLVQIRNQWFVQDVAIDGVSIAQHYRRSFTQVIRRDSFKGLLKKMRTQQSTIEKSS